MTSDGKANIWQILWGGGGGSKLDAEVCPNGMHHHHCEIVEAFLYYGFLVSDLDLQSVSNTLNQLQSASVRFHIFTRNKAERIHRQPEKREG